MRRFVLKREQVLPLPIEQVFAFFGEARNLETITPPWLGFRILTPCPIAMHAGTRIAYRLHWHHVRLRWLTEIRAWEPPHRFIDAQIRGPYRLWHHTHTFESVPGGTRMCDIVRYQLPFGLLGHLAHLLWVRRDLEAIFDYRARKVAELATEAQRHREPFSRPLAQPK